MRLLEKLINSEVLGSQGGDDGCNKRLWNVGKLIPDYTAQQP
jgi:hypothetical protein